MYVPPPRVRRRIRERTGPGMVMRMELVDVRCYCYLLVSVSYGVSPQSQSGVTSLFFDGTTVRAPWKTGSRFVSVMSIAMFAKYRITVGKKSK